MLPDQPEEILHRFGAAAMDADAPAFPDEPDALFEAALAFAALDMPGRSRAPYRALARRLVEDARTAATVADSAAERAATLAACLGARHRFSGDRETYDALENANLMAVIDRRKGLPVTLAILYIHLARSLGWSASGLNFPGHFLIRVEGRADRAVIDPFNDGVILTPAGMRRLLKAMAGDGAELKPAHYAPVSDRALLLRLQNNIKLRRLKTGDFAGAVAVLRHMLLIAPDDAECWYDLGVLEIHNGRLGQGRAALEKCLASLDLSPHASDLRDRALKTLRELAPSME